MDNVILILGLLLTLGIIILFVRFVHFLFMPSIHRLYAKVGQDKIERQLQEKGDEFVNGREVSISKAKSLGYKISFSEKVKFKVIHFQFVEGFNMEKDTSEYFWIKGSKIVWIHFLFPTKVEIFQEFDSDIIKNLKTWQFNEVLDVKIVESICPACQYKIVKSDSQCPDCGLVFQ